MSHGLATSPARWLRPCLFLLFGVALSGCGGGGGGSHSSGITYTVNGPLLKSTGVANQFYVYVGSNLFNSGSGDFEVPNNPWINVKICEPTNPTNCQTLTAVVSDTGSYGLRVLYAALNASLNLTAETPPAGSGTLAECVQFGGGFSTWGSVRKALITLGTETTTQAVPIQVVNDPSLPSAPTDTNCTDANSQGVAAYTPATNAGYLAGNAILGLGVFRHDFGNYYSCASGTCTAISAATMLANESLEVQNPVWLMTTDNNGILFSLPAVPADGAPNQTGTITLGINTESNNKITTQTVFPVDPAGTDAGDFDTTFPASGAGSTLYHQSFLDTGTNTLMFPNNTNIATCSDGFYCPTNSSSQPTSVNLSALAAGYNGTPTGTVAFQIANADSTLFTTSNFAFNDLGAPLAKIFDWGLPFFYGVPVFEALNGQAVSGSPGGQAAGPFYAFTPP